MASANIISGKAILAVLFIFLLSSTDKNNIFFSPLAFSVSKQSNQNLLLFTLSWYMFINCLFSFKSIPIKEQTSLFFYVVSFFYLDLCAIVYNFIFSWISVCDGILFIINSIISSSILISSLYYLEHKKIWCDFYSHTILYTIALAKNSRQSP